MNEELTSRDLQAAQKAGYLAGFGYGFAMTNDKKANVPFADVHLAWTNMVPGWIPPGMDSRGQRYWKKSFDLGMEDGKRAARETR